MSVPPLDRPVFAFDGRDYTWTEVVDAAKAWGEWAEVERLAGRRRARGGADEPSAADVDTAAAEFRYARGLLSADEMQVWLEHWGLTLGEWLGFVRSSLCPEQEDGEPPSFEAVWVEAVCSGELTRLSRLAAERLAACGSRHDRTDRTPAHLAGCFAEFCAEAVDDTAVGRTVAEHELGWTRLEWHHVAHPQEEAAREVVLCVREDARPLAGVARDAGVALQERSAYVDDLDSALAVALVGAQPSDVVGPLPIEGEFWVIGVDGRVAPTPADPLVRERAERLLLEQAIAREVLSRVRWHERL